MGTTGYVNGTIKKIKFFDSSSISNVSIEEQIEATFNFSRELIPYLNKDTGSYTKYEYGKVDWSVAGKAHLRYDATTGYETLLDAMMNKTKLTIVYTTDVAGDIELAGEVLIDNLSEATGTEEGVEFDFSFKGSGEPFIDPSLYPGVSWNSSTDVYARIGSLSGLPVSQSPGDAYLPTHSEMKRCMLLDDGQVNYYVDPDNPVMKKGDAVVNSGQATGTTANKLVASAGNFIAGGVVAGMIVKNITDGTFSIITAIDSATQLSLERDIFVTGESYEVGTANYGGVDGQVMVEIPKFYIKQALSGTTFSWYISKFALPGFTLHPAFVKDGVEVDFRYYSAFEGSMYDASAAAMTAKASVATDLYAAGDKMCSVAGQWAKTNETRAEYRAMAAERGTGYRQLDYYLNSAVQLLYLIEFADFNSQTMIGAGRTNLSSGTWDADSYIGMTGLSVADGNGTKSVALGSTLGYLTDYMTYRGIENFYGNVWKMIDGITWDGRWLGAAAAQPVYVTDNAADFIDQGNTNLLHLGDAPYIGSDAGYISNVMDVIGFIPSAAAGSSTTKFCDYYYQYSNLNNDFWRVVLFGDLAADAGTAGVFALAAHSAWSYASVSIAGRLCF